MYANEWFSSNNPSKCARVRGAQEKSSWQTPLGTLVLWSISTIRPHHHQLVEQAAAACRNVLSVDTPSPLKKQLWPYQSLSLFCVQSNEGGVNLKTFCCLKVLVEEWSMSTVFPAFFSEGLDFLFVWKPTKKPVSALFLFLKNCLPAMWEEATDLGNNGQTRCLKIFLFNKRYFLFCLFKTV